MIIHASMRTDIPAFYSEWFTNRIREGYVRVRNPYDPLQVTEYSLDPEVVDLIVFCSKNPVPMLKYMDLLTSYRTYWYITTDEMHRLVVKYLNSCGHNKAKYIVRAFLAYWKMSGKSLLSYVFPEIDAEQLLPEAKQENDKKTAVVAKASDAENDNGTYIQKDHSEQQLLEKSLQEDHFVNLEGDCEADEAEVLLIKNNYKMFEDLE